MYVLNKPKFMKPSTNKEECTIDLTADKIPFSCIVDGNESIKAWQIVVYDIITNDEVFNTGEITLESSFYPVDEKNRNVVFTEDIKQYPNTVTNTDAPPFINRADAYYWTIAFVGSSGNRVTSYQEVFYANKTPEIKFTYNGKDVDLNTGVPQALNSKDCTFKAELDFGKNEDGEDEYKAQLKRYGWRITDKSNGQVLVDTITKNQIYGSADNIVCSYGGFLNGNNYSVELFVETQNNTKVTSSFDITVSYSSTFLSNDFKVEALKNEPAIMLDWAEATVIAGILKDGSDNTVSVDDTTFKTNYPVDNQCSIEIPNKSKVIYDTDASLNFDIDENSYMAFSTQLLSNNATTLFFAEGTAKRKDDDGYYVVSREILYENGVFTYNIRHDGTIVAYYTHSVENRPSEYVWYNIFMSPLKEIDEGAYTTELIVYEGNVVDCVYPRKDSSDPTKDLYPRRNEEDPTKDFYPTFGKWSNLKEG